MPKPRYGDSVWVQSMGNGVIRHIDWEGDREVIVFFHHTKLEETFEWGEFDYFYENHNQWRILR